MKSTCALTSAKRTYITIFTVGIFLLVSYLGWLQPRQLTNNRVFRDFWRNLIVDEPKKEIEDELSELKVSKDYDELKPMKNLFHELLAIEKVEQRVSECNSYLEEYLKIINLGSSAIAYHNSMKDDVSTKIAFFYIVHNQPGLFEVLLHLTFRPYNAYCIYIGNNAPKEVAYAIRGIVSCYQQLYPETKIFLAANTTDIKWGGISLLKADLTCFEQLLALKDHPWEYAINLAGTELPLYSVDDLSGRLSVIKNHQKITTFSHYSKSYHNRHAYKYDENDCDTSGCKDRRGEKVTSTPYDMKIFKGVKNVFVRRDFVEFMLHHPVCQNFLEFLSHTQIPDEHFYATIARISKIETAEINGELIYTVEQQDNDLGYEVGQGYCPRFTLWDSMLASSRTECHGKEIFAN